MSEYREVPPSPRLAHAIECFWSMRHSGPATLHRVVPDGCADLLFTWNNGSVLLEAVGPMTAWRDFPQRDRLAQVGVRFHPGMWTAVLRVPGERITDQIVPLEGLWGSRAKELLDRLAGASSLEQSARLFEAALPPIESAGRLDRALAWMARHHGSIPIDEVADQAGFSARQFRRVCVEQTGLTPKFLARVMRFRHALARIGGNSGRFADFALDCGYYDQAHFINDFRELSGWTPSGCRDDRFFQASERG